MIDLALDPITRDLIFPPRPLGGAEKILQAVGIRLRTWLGDWFLDTTHGVPYLERILGKAPRKEMVEAVLRGQILSVAGVKSIVSFSLEINNSTRISRVEFSVNTTEGIASGSLSLQR